MQFPDERRRISRSLNRRLRTKDVVTYLTPTVILYSTNEKPSTALVLRPGDSIRLLGTSILPATGFGPEWVGNAMLQGHLCLASVSVRAAPAGGARKGTQMTNNALWCVNADQKYEVTLAPKQ
jgi:hypothetical protein